LPCWLPEMVWALLPSRLAVVTVLGGPKA
jgi:hypothetical protein